MKPRPMSMHNPILVRRLIFELYNNNIGHAASAMSMTIEHTYGTSEVALREKLEKIKGSTHLLVRS